MSPPSACDKLREDLKALFRAHDLGAGDLASICNEMGSSYSQFPLRSDDSQLGQFLASFKEVLYFAIFAHAPKVESQVSSKCNGN